MPLRPWTVHARRLLHHGHLRIEEHDVETADGQRFVFPVLYMSGFAKVLPVTPHGTVVFVRQYRHAFGGVTLELPAGGIGPGEDPAHAARRELGEETGLRAGRLEHLGTFATSPGRSNERGFVYLATDCVPDPEARPDEPTEPVEVPVGDAVGLIGREVHDASSTLALLLARDRLAGWTDTRPPVQ